MTKKRKARRRSVKAVLVVRGQKVGTATFKNPSDAKAWARAVGASVKDGRRRKAGKRQKAKAKRARKKR